MPIRPQVQVPAALADLLRRLAAEGQDRGLALALVGGAVRDLLLGLEPLDLDITVAGTAPHVLAFGRTVAGWFGAEPESHAAFGTASLRLSLGGREANLDLTMRRQERYAHPGALPEVAPGSWAEDLSRRDFTINALAWPLTQATDCATLRPADLLTATHALDDLAASELRVLHDGSFVDDPTRLCRAARLAARLVFHLEEGTFRLAADAVKQGVLKTVSPQRLGHELRLTAAEPRAFAAFQLLAELGFWGALLPGWQEPDATRLGAVRGGLAEALALLADAATATRSSGPASTPGAAGTPPAARMLPDPALSRLLAWLAAGAVAAGAAAPDLAPLGLQGRAQTVLSAGLTSLPDLLAHLTLLGPAPGPATVDSSLCLVPAEVQAALYALAPVPLRQQLSLYWLALRERPVLVGGSDLAALGWQPGPAFGVALQELRRQVLDGSLSDRSSQLAWLQQYGKYSTAGQAPRDGS